MGSMPIKTVISQLENNSSSVLWTDCREVTLFRGQFNKLGLRFITICQQPGSDFCTLIIKIKDTCSYLGELKVSDKILSINGLCITNYSEQEVSNILENVNVSEYHLVVQSVKLSTDDKQTDKMSSEHLLPKGKRNMSSSSSHGTSSQGSVEHIKISGSNKKLAKSNSLEKDLPSSPPSLISPYEVKLLSPPSAIFRKKDHGASHAYHPLVDIDHILPISNSRNDGINASPGTHIFCQPGVPMSHQWDRLAHETSYSRTQSLPVSCDDDIGLEEIMCEVQSLPLQSGVPSSCNIGPHSSSSNQNMTDSGLGSSKFQEPDQLDIPVCRTQSCNVQQCIWHKAILKYPQHIIWDPCTKAITLEKSSNTVYGFHYKIKVHVHPRETCIYALVDKIEPGMPASGKLEIGDWIRSANGNAFQTPVEADSMNMNKSNTLRLVIQRPMGISLKAESCVRQMKKTLKASVNAQTADSRSTSSPIRQPASISPRTSANIGLSPKMSVSPLMGASENRTQNCKFCGHEKGLSPDSMFIDPFFCSSALIDDSMTAIKTEDRMSLNTPKEIPVPKVRLFICGNKGNVFANLLIMGASNEAKIPLESHVHYFRLCLRKSDKSRVTFDKWLFGLTENRDESNTSDSPRSKSSNPCLKCSSNFRQINADIFVISDENFFHHCSHFLFTKNSVFLIAFDAHKLLNLASAEISRIENMLHTIRSFASNSALVQLHGMLASDTEKADEVRTLFYTSHGKQLSRYAISIPDIVFLQKDEDLDVLERLRSSVFDIANSLFTRQSVSLKSLQLSDALSGNEGRTKCVWSSEELAVLLQSVYDKNFLQRTTAQELIQLGDLVPVTLSGHSGPDQYIIPVDILPRLAHLVLWAGVETSPNTMSISTTEAWTKLLTTAMLTRRELLILLDRNIMDSAMFVTCLESLGIIFKISQSSGESGTGPTYLIPYFLIDCHPSEQVSDQSSHQVFVVFKTRISWVTFFGIVSALGQLPECSDLKMNGPCSCLVLLEGIPINLFFLKTLDRVRILIQKGRGMAKEKIALELIRKLLATTVSRDEDYIFGPVCPLSENHRQSTEHILDLSSGSNICCAGIQLDQHPTVRFWLSAVTQDDNDNVTVEDKLKQSINSLPFSILHKINNRLSIEHTHDWTDLAARLGKTLEEVELYKSVVHSGSLPAEEFLKELGRTTEGTVGILLQTLKDMERLDIYGLIGDYLQQ